MATELLLMFDIEKLGMAGEIVQVADGYARNYLLPKGYAAPVSKNALRKLEKLRKEREELTRIQRAEAVAKAATLKGLEVTLTAKVIDPEEGRLYGSVTLSDVMAAVEAKNIALDRSQIIMEDAFKALGSYEVPVQLFKDIREMIKVIIIAE